MAAKAPVGSGRAFGFVFVAIFPAFLLSHALLRQIIGQLPDPLAWKRSLVIGLSVCMVLSLACLVTDPVSVLLAISRSSA